MPTVELIARPPSTKPLRLASDTQELSGDQALFFQALLGPTETEVLSTGPSSVDYIPLPSSGNLFFTDSIIVRTCYNHLLPQIHNNLLDARRSFRTAVTGSPGIGKSVFGAILLRRCVQQKQSAIYWERDNIYLFSFEKAVSRAFGLSEFARIDGSICCAGYWNATETRHWSNLFHNDLDLIVIHDPKDGDTRVVLMEDQIKKIVYILSNGHYLISHWARKGGGPSKYYYLPLWTKREALRSLTLLKQQGPDSEPLKSEDTESLYNKFGGCIRGWVAQTDVWTELTAKVKEVVKSQGDNILTKHTTSKGSIVHLYVDFDEERPIQPFRALDNADEQPSESVADDVAASLYNTFHDYRYIFGSLEILKLMDTELLNQGDETFKLCLRNWASESGFECVYGALFELRCHRLFENNTGNLQLRMRVVRRNDSENTKDVTNVRFPAASGTVRYKSNDPSILKESTFDGLIEKGKYLWPHSSNHPSYDSAIVLDEDVVGLHNVGNVGLLLQMTVSGATGLPRRPEHSIKQYVRKAFDGVFQARIPGYRAAAYTAFVVPTECFEKFLFQHETLKDDDDMPTKVQPELQFVFEVPDIFSYSPQHGVEELPSANEVVSRKRVHRYATRTSKLAKMGS